MLIVITDVSLKHIDVSLNFASFWTFISFKEYGISISDENKFVSRKTIYLS